MKPAPFDYCAPTSLEEVLQLVGDEADARVLAGGQSLVPMMNLRLAQPERLVDLNRVPRLDQLDANAVAVSIGAMVRQDALARSEAVADRWPLLHQAVGYVGYPATRHRGTVGGSAAHADPAAELPAALLALDAQFVAQRRDGSRTIDARDFFLDYYTTALEPGEILTEIRVAALPAGCGTAFLELARRYHDFPICGVAAALGCGADGRIEIARLGLAGVGPGPVRANGAEAVLSGAEPGEAVFEAAAAAVATEIEPLGDLHGSAAYRRRVAAVMTRRALEAAARAIGGKSA